MTPIPLQEKTKKYVRVQTQDIISNTLWLTITLIGIYLFVRILGIDDIRGRVALLGAWGPITIILLKASTLVVAPLGGGPLYPLAGAAFGFWWGFVLTFTGDIIGSAIAFYISRIWGRSVVQYLVTKPGMRVVDAILSYISTTRGLIYARLIFFSFPEGVTYAAGLTPIPFWKFLALMVPIGVGPAALLVAFGDIFSFYRTTHPTVIALIYLASIALMVGGGYWLYRQAQQRVSETHSTI